MSPYFGMVYLQILSSGCRHYQWSSGTPLQLRPLSESRRRSPAPPPVQLRARLRRLPWPPLPGSPQKWQATEQRSAEPDAELPGLQSNQPDRTSDLLPNLDSCCKYSWKLGRLILKSCSSLAM